MSRTRCPLLLLLCSAFLVTCSSESPSGPSLVIGRTHRLVSISGVTVPAMYYAEPGYFQATAISGSIVFLANGYVRAETLRRIDYVPSAGIPDEVVTGIDSVPYRVEGEMLLIERLHGWDTAQVNGGLRVHWTSSTASLGIWLYYPN